MDIKTKLENEIIFDGRTSSFFQGLNKRGIVTIEDYINADAEQLGTDKYRRREHRTFQNILKYKYLGEPLVIDVLLDMEYDKSQSSKSQLESDSITLGVKAHYSRLYRQLKENETIKMIDILREMQVYATNELINFYIKYYDTKLKKGISNDELVEKDKDALESLKKELVTLKSKENELDSKTSILTEQINTLESGKTVNGK